MGRTSRRSRRTKSSRTAAKRPAPEEARPSPEASAGPSTTGPLTPRGRPYFPLLREDSPLYRRGFMIGSQRSSGSSSSGGAPPTSSPSGPTRSAEPLPSPTGDPSSLSADEEREEDRLDRAHWEHRYRASNPGPIEWNHEAIIACRFSFRCPQLWSRLQPTADASIRTCATCVQQVHLVRSEGEFEEHARQGHCVAVHVSRSGDEGAMTWVGEPRRAYCEPQHRDQKNPRVPKGP